MAGIICPFCLKSHDFQTGSNFCTDYPELKVPNPYINDHRAFPPLWLLTAGFTKHGKTTYLAALRLVLDHITRIEGWRNVYLRELDQYTQDEIRGWRRDDREGRQVKGTPEKVARPLLLQIDGVPGYGARGLVMYDLPGQIFDELESVRDMAPAMRHASTTWFFVSLRDISRDQTGRSLHELFQAYIGALEEMNVKLEGQNLIIIYTKGDLEEHQMIKNYLREDPLRAVSIWNSGGQDIDFDLDEYEAEMAEFSDRLEDYTKSSVRGGATFVNMVRGKGMHLVFAATAAQPGGNNEEGVTLKEREPRYRIIDPFLWALKLQRQKQARAVVLALDSSETSAGIYSGDLVRGIWNLMEQFGEVTTFYLGQSSPASGPGQAPPIGSAVVKSPRLIAPLLESGAVPEGSSCLVLSGGTVLDLPDLAGGSWEPNVYIAGRGDAGAHPEWSNGCVLRDGDDPAVLVNNFFKAVDSK